MIMTNGTTRNDSIRSRNELRLKLWSDDQFAHQWLCHPGENCSDGCDLRADLERNRFYFSDLEGMTDLEAAKLCLDRGLPTLAVYYADRANR